MSKSILVTGCHGDIGTAIGRILKISFPNFNILGADITLEGPGKFIYDYVVKLPYSIDDEYGLRLSELIVKRSIDLIIPASESETRYFNANGFCKSFKGIAVLMSNKKTLDFSHDKYKTSILLNELHLLHPWTKLIHMDPVELPCIIKNRGLKGKGGVVQVFSQDAVDFYRNQRPDDIWQEYLEGDEFTCGLYGFESGEIRSIVFKRKLSNGNSGFTISGEVVNNQDINVMLNTLASGLELVGSCNVQLKLTKNGPLIFEINPRFSSTVMFRHLLGFKDLKWSCDEIFGFDPDIYVPPRPGIKFYKGYTEYIDS